MPKKNDIKLQDNQILWWNGAKWLVKETLVDRDPKSKVNIALAKKRFAELNA